jgi:hypothetical protein
LTPTTTTDVGLAYDAMKQAKKHFVVGIIMKHILRQQSVLTVCDTALALVESTTEDLR